MLVIGGHSLTKILGSEYLLTKKIYIELKIKITNSNNVDDTVDEAINNNIDVSENGNWFFKFIQSIYFRDNINQDEKYYKMYCITSWLNVI